MKAKRAEIMICGGTGCVSSGSLKVKKALDAEIIKVGLQDEIVITITGCAGFCAKGPLLLVKPENILYQSVTPKDVPELVSEHLLKGRPLKRLLYTAPEAAEIIPLMDDIPFFSKQLLWVLRNRGILDPEKIEEYIAMDGYMGAYKALVEMTPEQIIQEVKKSGLRGRGGAGFPTGLKWEYASKSPSDIKYVLCNADEGDPGAFMDRSILEADPHAVLEGMIIAGKAIGAHQGYIYCRAEYPLALHRLDVAINQAREYGLLGKDIFQSGFDFDIEVYQGAGAFVCGEETALMQSIEGKRGMPRPRPPFPAQKGLWNKPSILNNVETLANIPQIILKGGDWYASVGTQGSKGTKVFALSGAINNIGLVEVPMGTTLKEIIYEIGGGIKNNRKFKAVQLGGPSGGCVPGHLLDIPTDYEAITKVGAIMGSGGMIVMDEETCMVDVARFFLDFCQEESCGKCTPCREGTKRMLEILEKIVNGEGEEKHIEELKELSYFVKDSSLCGLGQTAPNPVLSTLQYFLEEYQEHIIEKYCRAGVCSNLVRAKCINACPLGQNVPGYLSLVSEGRYQDAITLIYEANPLPGICGRVCTHPCMDMCIRSQLDEPLQIAGIKRFAADMARANRLTPNIKAIANGKEEVAIVGGGPAGLSAAFYLALMGYRPHIFEALPKLGGNLRYGIPSFRLPRDILEEEIQFILSQGVQVTTNCTIGKDISFEELKAKYPAIFVATGSNKSRKAGISGEDIPGVMGAVEFLRALELGKAPDIGKKVSVLGGDMVAVDVARTVKRLGADVTILFNGEKKNMPVDKNLLEQALEEGIVLKTLVAPKTIHQNGNRLSILFNECKPGGYDNFGKRIPVPIEDKTFTEDCDTLLLALEQIPDLAFPMNLDPEKGTVTIDRFTFKTGLPGVFAGGDVVLGLSCVADAIAHGKKAAIQIDKYLSQLAGRDPVGLPKVFVEVTQKTPKKVRKKEQKVMPKLDPLERIKGFKEVETGYSEEEAKEESLRCLRCDVKL